ncbi:CapA family protein [Kitasatospora sp. NPDC059571]|uniref:CapA family protein n=1 Tax=Kitasatospora sp. NPDC059571 TaxID=3346871 RepID=UPI0036AE0585
MRRAVPAAALLIGLLSVTACGSGPSPTGRAPAGDAQRPGGPSASGAVPGPSGSTGADADASPPGPSAAGSAPPGTTFTVAFAGDVHFEGRAKPRLSAGPGETALGPIAATLARADLSVLNLETAITGRGAPEPKTYTFRTSPRALQVLHDAGVDVVSMANNHAVDFGADGLADTLAAKASSPVPVIGVGRNAAEAYAPYVTSVKGVKVAVVAASQVSDLTNDKWRAGPGKPGIASARDADALVAAVRSARAQAPVVLVYLHWGEEGRACPTGEQTAVARRLAAAGASAVVGTHAHTMLGAGMLGSTYVAYGFGNFLWYATSNYPGSDETGVTTVTFTADGRTVGERFTPAHIDGRGVPVPQTGAAAAAALRRREGLRSCTGLAPVPQPAG